MTKKQWIITAAVIFVIVAAMSLYYVPRSVERTLELPEWQTAYIESHVTKSGHDGIYIHRTEDAADFLASLQALQLKYVDGKHFYEIGAVTADVFVHYDNGRGCSMTLSDNGLVRYNDQNYRCTDTAALKDLLVQIESWENTSGLTTSIWGEVSLGPLDQQPFRTQDADQIAQAVALLEELQARRTFDDNTVSVRNDAYNAQMTLTYAGGEAEVWFGEWGWLRYQEQNYMAEDPAVTKALMELVKGWIIAE